MLTVMAFPEAGESLSGKCEGVVEEHVSEDTPRCLQTVDAAEECRRQRR